MRSLGYFCLLLLIEQSNSALSDVTSEVFKVRDYHSIIAAFGDFNADKATDIFALTGDGTSLIILEADIDIRHDGTKFTSKPFIRGAANDSAIINVVPGDFNRDSQMDVLVMRKAGNAESAPVKVEIYLWNGNTGELYLTVKETFRDQPIIIECDSHTIFKWVTVAMWFGVCSMMKTTRISEVVAGIDSWILHQRME